MSLCTRSDGRLGYWASLDLAAVHFGRMKAVLESTNQATPAIEFGSGSLFDNLAEAARFCGLSWSQELAQRVFDSSCVHHEPATVVHEAQMLYEELGGHRPPLIHAEQNGWILARDARKCEALTKLLASPAIELHNRVVAQQEQLARAHHELVQAQTALCDAQDQLEMAREEVDRGQMSEERMREECQRLRAQRDRFESHPILGRILRARRLLKGLRGETAVRLPITTASRHSLARGVVKQSLEHNYQG
jgi:hypothetical protein